MTEDTARAQPLANQIVYILVQANTDCQQHYGISYETQTLKILASQLVDAPPARNHINISTPTLKIKFKFPQHKCSYDEPIQFDQSFKPVQIIKLPSNMLVSFKA